MRNYFIVTKKKRVMNFKKEKMKFEQNHENSYGYLYIINSSLNDKLHELSAKINRQKKMIFELREQNVILHEEIISF